MVFGWLSVSVSVAGGGRNVGLQMAQNVGFSQAELSPLWCGLGFPFCA